MVRLLTIALLAVPAAPARADHPWTQVVVLSGAFETTRASLERVRESDAVDNATLVLHDPPARDDTVLYRAHYCPAEARTPEHCLSGGVEYLSLIDVDPAWHQEVRLDGEALTRLLVWAVETHPSERLLVTLKGRSRFGHVLRDDDEGDDVGFTIDDLHHALRAVRDVRGAPADVVVLASSASASLEWLAVLHDVARYVVATQESIGDDRSAYFRLPVWMAELREHPEQSARDLASHVAWVYRDPSYPSFDADLPFAVSVVDLSRMPTVVERLSGDFGRLIDRGDAGVDVLEEASSPVWRFGDQQTRVDVAGLLEGLAALDADAPVPNGVASRLALNAAVVETYASPEGPRGLSLFLPADPAVQWDLRKSYRARFGSFPHESGWKRLLKARLQLARERAGGCAAVGRISAWVAVVTMLLALRRAREVA